MDSLLTIIAVIFVVLQIILFIKVWEMTNDINSIKRNLSTDSLICKAKILSLKGKFEEAKEMLDESFLLEVTSFTGFYEAYSDFYEKSKKRYQKLYEKLNIEPIDFDSLKERSHKMLG